MNKLVCTLILFWATGQLFGQSCANLNTPTAIADSCQNAPLLCGNYLENYCGTNAGLTNDAFGLSSGFLRFAPCETNIKLQFSVSNCAAGDTGLVFRLYTETCIANPVLASVTVYENMSGTMAVNNLQVLNNYLLAVSGVQGSACEFNIQVIEGIGTALPGPADCNCDGGGVEGPDLIYSYEPVTYSIGAPSCFLNFGTPIVGNGEYCPPASACPVSLDSIVVVWHIPSVAHFVGDSTGTTVVIQLNSDYFGLDTMRFDTVWANWHLVTTEPMDPLAFCECSVVNCASGDIPKPILIWRETIEYACELTCMQPTCTIDGITYDTPGVYTYESPPGVFVEVTITKEEHDPLVPDKTICVGETASLAVTNFDPNYNYEWSTGETGSAISVTPITTTSYTVTARNPNDTCVYTTTVLVTVLPIDTTDIGQVGAITCTKPCFIYLGIDYCIPGEYIVPVDSCSSNIFQIGFEKDTINLGEVGKITCAQNCVTYNGTQYCQGGIYSLSDSCTIRLFSIGEEIDPPVCSTVFTDCLPSNTHFRVSFLITGLPPYKVDGNSLGGNYFLSDPQLNGEPYAFIVEQTNGCQTVVSGTYDCAQFCISNAGKLSPEILHGCAGQDSVQVQSLEMPTLAPGDVQDFVLQTNDGMVLAHNAMGNFAFDPATMVLEEIYLAIRNVGPPDTNGMPDFANACTDTSNTQPVVFHALPRVAVSGDSSLCEGGMLILTASGADTYVWNEGSTGAILEIQIVEEIHEGTYSVVGTDVHGCSGEDSSAVVVRPQQSEGCCRPQLPNAFTPNGDGANDSFIPILPDCNKLEFAEMRIYSRWGELVFQSSDNGERWDGNSPNGAPASSDTYVFTFRYRLEGDEEKTQKGEVTLLR
ncbi:MAG: gliding motility-associated C-terminal domain-containing protein [Phycisphaerae bacterium]|nr:gliding motility-associated C-terminal domain-containing protein [Saprospiraceae bacterium]